MAEEFKQLNIGIIGPGNVTNFMMDHFDKVLRTLEDYGIESVRFNYFIHRDDEEGIKRCQSRISKEATTLEEKLKVSNIKLDLDDSNHSNQYEHDKFNKFVADSELILFCAGNDIQPGDKNNPFEQKNLNELLPNIPAEYQKGMTQLWNHMKDIHASADPDFRFDHRTAWYSLTSLPIVLEYAKKFRDLIDSGKSIDDKYLVVCSNPPEMALNFLTAIVPELIYHSEGLSEVDMVRTKQIIKEMAEQKTNVSIKETSTGVIGSHAGMQVPYGFNTDATTTARIIEHVRNAFKKNFDLATVRSENGSGLAHQISTYVKGRCLLKEDTMNAGQVDIAGLHKLLTELLQQNKDGKIKPENVLHKPHRALLNAAIKVQAETDPATPLDVVAGHTIRQELVAHTQSFVQLRDSEGNNVYSGSEYVCRKDGLHLVMPRVIFGTNNIQSIVPDEIKKHIPPNEVKHYFEKTTHDYAVLMSKCIDDPVIKEQTGIRGFPNPRSYGQEKNHRKERMALALSWDENQFKPKDDTESPQELLRATIEKSEELKPYVVQHPDHQTLAPFVAVCDLTNGSVIERIITQSPVSSMTSEGDVLYLGSDKQITIHNLRTGKTDHIDSIRAGGRIRSLGNIEAIEVSGDKYFVIEDNAMNFDDRGQPYANFLLMVDTAVKEEVGKKEERFLNITRLGNLEAVTLAISGDSLLYADGQRLYSFDIAQYDQDKVVKPPEEVKPKIDCLFDLAQCYTDEPKEKARITCFAKGESDYFIGTSDGKVMQVTRSGPCKQIYQDKHQNPIWDIASTMAGQTEMVAFHTEKNMVLYKPKSLNKESCLVNCEGLDAFTVDEDFVYYLNLDSRALQFIDCIDTQDDPFSARPSPFDNNFYDFNKKSRTRAKICRALQSIRLFKTQNEEKKCYKFDRIKIV